MSDQTQTKKVASDLSPARIEEVRAEFAHCLDSDAPLSIEECLSRVSAADFIACLRELLPVEAARRRQRGERPSSREYQKRFPFLDSFWIAEAIGEPCAGAAKGASSTL